MKNNILGVKIDYVTLDQAVKNVEQWLRSRGRHYIVTPNPEMLVDSRLDTEFKKALNEADLAIPDSPRLGWASKLIALKSPLLKLIYAPFFIFPKILTGEEYPTTTGVDLTEALIRLSEEKGYRTAYLGGSRRVAVKLFKCLKLKYPRLKIIFCSGDILVNADGKSQFDTEYTKKTRSKDTKIEHSPKQFFNAHALTEQIDILFLAFGHKKQEKWMLRNLPKLNTRVMVGVGGAFDYISGEVSRAPQIFQSLGFEWVYRFVLQPWRIRRFWKLPYFIYMVMIAK